MDIHSFFIDDDTIRAPLNVVLNEDGIDAFKLPRLDDT
jgi:hypothetical protein